MNQHELLTQLDRWAWAYKPRDAYTAELLKQAAAEIRRLQTLKYPPLTDEETATVLEVFGRTDSEAEAGL